MPDQVCRGRGAGRAGQGSRQGSRQMMYYQHQVAWQGAITFPTHFPPKLKHMQCTLRSWTTTTVLPAAQRARQHARHALQSSLQCWWWRSSATMLQVCAVAGAVQQYGEEEWREQARSVMPCRQLLASAALGRGWQSTQHITQHIRPHASL